MKEWLAHADQQLADNANREAVLAGGPAALGALYLSLLPGNIVLKSYRYTGNATDPDRLIGDVTKWAQIVSTTATFRSFLSRVWRDARGFPSNQMADAIYDLYGGQTAGNPVVPPQTDGAYFDQLLADYGAFYAGWNALKQGDYFLHLESPGWAQIPAEERTKSQRFYFNPGPDYRTAVNAFFRMLSGVVARSNGKGKIIGPSQYGARSDCIILWIPNASASGAEATFASRGLAGFGATSGSAVPPMLRPVGNDPSMGTGEEPRGGGAHSFGSLRAALLAEALDGAGSFEEFIDLARIAFRVANIPWDAPDRGGTGGGTLTRVINRSR